MASVLKIAALKNPDKREEGSESYLERMSPLPEATEDAGNTVC